MDTGLWTVNGSYSKNKNATPLLGPATPNSVHNKVWVEGKKIFKTMEFVTSGRQKEYVPSIENWVWTLNGLQILLKKLKEDFGVSSVWLRHLNQDPLEKFAMGIATSILHVTILSRLLPHLINKMNSVQTRGNCEGDLCNALYTLSINENAEAISTCTHDFVGITDCSFTPVQEKECDPRKVGPIQYVSGYLKQKYTKIFKSCKDKVIYSALTAKNELEYIRYREYASRTWLCTPSNELIEMISH